MEGEIFKVFVVATVFFALFVGALGCFLPVLPGVIIAGFAVLFAKLALPELPVSWAFVWASLIMSVLVQIADFLLTYYGAKKFGATKWGAIGAFVGVFVGIFIPPPLLWIFLAPFLFAFAFEYIGGASARVSLKAGFGSFVGVIFASVVKFVLVVFIAFGFAWSVFLR